MFETYIGDNPKLASLTPERALELLERAVQEKGADYKDPNAVTEQGCRYFDPETGEPQCIVGHVLAYEGFEYEDFPELGYAPTIEYWEHFGNRKQTASAAALFDRKPDVSRLLALAQEMQDDGQTWGEALKAARSAVS